MNPQNCTVGLLFGGRSAEHEVSLLSAANVEAALREVGYNIVLIGIDRSGRWFLVDHIHSPEAEACVGSDREPNATPDALPVTFAPGCGGRLVSLDGSGKNLATIDVVFPVLHGPFGEDGTVQGLLRLANVAFVGPDVLGSAVAMDKDVAKRLLHHAGIPVVDGLVLSKGDVTGFETVRDTLGLPVFVKPANLGSSVGVSKAGNQAEFDAAVKSAFHYDDKILIEKDAGGREIECAVLTLKAATPSLPGEIVPADAHGFYSYDAKYIDGDGAKLLVPADLSDAMIKQVQDLSVSVVRILCCEGMARVDFFLTANGDLFVNEVNTIPGFTAISMYPKLWEATGKPPADLVTSLIDHALGRFARQQMLETRHS